ncbi:AMP-binding protein [Clostridium estertheticum]|uniref:AMP-binding protein n=1 Tax=Clostridium estertheticum TaxID=238834 RepID=UPI001C0D65FF|nr:AMP-binding protein [Clostridium estertheticum]MBU3072723.1 AMP-binding protein [Clostridium estertheticum]MBU3162816.1 AMP-binding protein [Clostridium estertheticum]
MKSTNYEFNVVDEKERHKLLVEFNDNSVDYPTDVTVQELFEQQVEKTPDNIAVIYEDKKLTYRELNERANAVAKVLIAKGVQADDIVGIMVETSIEMLVQILAILKAGGAYMPIDQQYPDDRIAYMLEDSKAKLLLTQEKFEDRIKYQVNICDISKENVDENDNCNLGKTSDEYCFNSI